MDKPPTSSEQKALLKSIERGIKMNGRKLEDHRKVKFIFGDDSGRCQALLGNTKVMVEIVCTVVQPKQGRPNEGILKFILDLDAIPKFDQQRVKTLINKALDKCFIQSDTLDMESLVISYGRRAWQLDVGISVFCNDGNLVGCISMAVSGALLHLKLPVVKVINGNVSILSEKEKEPIPLRFFSHTVVITYALFHIGGRTHIIQDPTGVEEQLSDVMIIFVVKGDRSVCGILKEGTGPLKSDFLMCCTDQAFVTAPILIKALKDAMYSHLESKTRSLYSNGMRNALSTLGSFASSLKYKKTKTTAEPMVEEPKFKISHEVMQLGQHSAEMFFGDFDSDLAENDDWQEMVMGNPETAKARFTSLNDSGNDEIDDVIMN